MQVEGLDLPPAPKRVRVFGASDLHVTLGFLGSVQEAEALRAWTLIGGLCYTVGTVFLVFDNQVRHFHALWHVFVIAGSACHFFVILFFVAPLR